jgi:hypothetical protein
LYMCGSATHPGGGIMGAPGRIASQVILKEWKKAVAASRSDRSKPATKSAAVPAASPTAPPEPAVAPEPVVDATREVAIAADVAPSVVTPDSEKN